MGSNFPPPHTSTTLQTEDTDPIDADTRPHPDASSDTSSSQEAPTDMEGRPCRLCHTPHSVARTACPTANWFVTTDPSLRTRLARSDGIAPGAVVLSILEGAPSALRTCTFRTTLCPPCEQQALKNGRRWHRRTGECCNSKCSNYESCDCYTDLPCDDYVYMPTCPEQNLDHEELAVAIDDGRVRIVTAAQEQTMWIRETAVAAKDEGNDFLRAGQPIALADLADAVVCLEEELLVIAMYDQRLADFLDGGKSFTFSKVNGFVETPGRFLVGPWIKGRIVEDDFGQMWHIPKGKPVVIRTEDDVSRVVEMIGDRQESDPLGTYII